MSIERNSATIATLKRAKKVIKKLKQRESQITFRPIGNIIKIQVFADASHANLPDGMSSTCGYFIILEGEKGRRIIDWNSTKIQRKVSSTLEAEALSLKEALSNAIYLGSFLTELMFGDFNINKFPIEAFTDNRPTEQSIRSTEQVQEKRLRIDIGEIQRLIEQKEITDVKWICKEKQLADGLTKRDVDMENVMNILDDS